MFPNKSVENKQRIRRKRFTNEEDKKIKKLVERYGENWNEVSKHYGPSRKKRQLKERWQNYLNPNLSPEFTRQEDIILYDLYMKLGSRWEIISKQIGNKSSTYCKKRIRAIEKGIKVYSDLINKKSHDIQQICHENNKESYNRENNDKVIDFGIIESDDGNDFMYDFDFNSDCEFFD